MKIKTLLLTSLILIGSMGIISCDPMRSVQIKNKTGQDVRLKIIQDTTNLLSLDNKSVLELDLKSSGNLSTALFIDKFGNYSKQDLKSFNSMIKELRIETNSDTCIISGDELTNYLPKRRSKLFNNYLNLKIKKCPIK